MNRQNEVQRLVIPLVIVHNATPSLIAINSDESFVAVRTASVDQITPALSAGEVATYSVSPVDASGIFNIFVKIAVPQSSNEQGLKIMEASLVDRINGGSLPCKLGSASGLSSLGNLMLTGVSGINEITTDSNLCLIVEYTVVQS
jgi:hypothetical protein